MPLLAQKQSSKTTKPVRIISTITFVIFFLFIIFSWTPASIVLEKTQHILYSTSSSLNTFIVQIFSPSDSLKSQINYYQELAANSVSSQTETAQLKRRVKELEELLGYQQSVEYKTIAAKVLSYAPSEQLTLLIDQGFHDGVKTGLAVVINTGFLIGTIDSVSEYTSTVRLLEDPQSSIPVSIINGESTSGMLNGEEGFLLHMYFIPHDRILSIGDIIVTSNLYERIPNELPIGTIHEIILDETSPFQEALVEPLYSTSEYSNVLIIDTTSVRIYEE